MGPKYDGDVISLKVSRGGKDVIFASVKLGGALAAVATPFLGILPMRDDPEAGVEVRYVYPAGPADVAGLKAGDRVMKYLPAAVHGAAGNAGDSAEKQGPARPNRRPVGGDE